MNHTLLLVLEGPSWDHDVMLENGSLPLKLLGALGWLMVLKWATLYIPFERATESPLQSMDGHPGFSGQNSDWSAIT